MSMIDAFAMDAFGLTKKQAKERHVCIRCKQPPVLTTEPEKKEYDMSALCPLCWDAIFDDGGDDKDDDGRADDLNKQGLN